MCLINRSSFHQISLFCMTVWWNNLPLEQPCLLCHWKLSCCTVFVFTDCLQFSPYSDTFLCLSFFSEIFCDSDKRILKENDIVRFPKLADTYQRIAEEGPDVFYNGTMAQTIVEDIQAAGDQLFKLFKRAATNTSLLFENH